MFFLRMISKALRQQLGKRVMIAVTICLGAALTTSMMAVMLDIGDKVKQELSSYGANIEVTPKGASVVSELYGTDEEPTGALVESELPRLKSIFWAYNLEDFAPYLKTTVRVGTAEPTDVTLSGTWFTHTMTLDIGEPVETGLLRLREWWDVDGVWADDDDPQQAMVGANVAAAQGWSVGDEFQVSGTKGDATLRVAGIFHAGDDEDDTIYAPLATAQQLTARPGEVDRIEVRAITTPENELSQRAERDPSSLSVADWETWYCTAYVSSISYQIEEALTDAVAKPVRQIADSEGVILEKTQLIMGLIAVLAMVGSALGIANLVTASVMERAPEIGLLKAIGARNASVVLLILAETMVVGLVGGVVGFGLGVGLAQIIGQMVFSSWITLRPLVLPVMAVLVISMILAGSLPSLRALMKLKPSDVLHGK
ncbi:ABC transporter permease [Tessaracoccus caeni]|uniref:ABC transporter permease n=1 Tax=Tessaracoccus caeni TaxID=3031239 RepID=UPI0023D9C310|nr:ABC transporter permease [Tessaracoccus caeni]MDF1487867.1 ABC transporter permease [Tessaracoccus caeni]